MRSHVLCGLAILVLAGMAFADQPKRVLLLGQKRDHPPGRHEYMAGLRILEKCLADVPGLEVRIVAADEPWPDGPQLLEGCDGVVLSLGTGAKWLQATPQRLAALQALAARQGGIVALHWAIGSKELEYRDRFVELVGGFHGGADRRFLVLETDVHVADRQHPIAAGIDDLRVTDEFYFRLKFAAQGTIRPLFQATIEGAAETVGWAYERPDGGRSFGFSGLDAHRNWRHVAYRRLAAQAVLWTLQLPVPPAGLPVDVPPALLEPPPPE